MMEGRPGPSTRRPPAHQSVSLRHTSAKAPTTSSPEKQTSSSSEQANPPSSVSPTLQAQKQSSGESSDAGAWFDNTNKNAEQTIANAQFADNDPPFFLRNNSSSSETPPEGGYAYAPPSASMPYRPNFIRMPTEGSNSEDFRGVIDDLTVANKKLKQKLKKYEKVYDAHLQDQKLFEVRFHGLPDHKKKELEETLRKFAQGLDEPATDAPVQLKPMHTVSSVQNTESGYATMSGSGRNSTSAPSGAFSGVTSGMRSGTSSANDHHRQRASRSSYNQHDHHMQSYLLEISAGLLPHPSNAHMSDSTKKKLVVRRLEQVFAGKLSTPGVHQQPAQQEEVAQSAALADRIAKEATGGRVKEGIREALIMPMDHQDEEMVTPPNPAPTSAPSGTSNDPEAPGFRSPDQRPTRPLDLDPARAQVPADNMEYIRHLGFVLPPSGEVPQDGQGWVYLNLLINMAQLHTINVTPDFVKDALNEYSSKFELSHDGRKVRWKGGQDITLNSDSSSEQLSGNSVSEAAGGHSSRSASKILQTEHNGESTDSLESQNQARRARSAKEKERNKLAYTPLFFHRQDSEEDDDIFNGLSSSSNSPPFGQLQGDSSAFTSSGLRSESSRKKRDDGPMIFYTKAAFCTDLSGDREGRSPNVDTKSYQSVATEPLGVADTTAETKFTDPFGLTEPKGPLEASDFEMDTKEPDQLGPSSEEDFVMSIPDLRSESSGKSPSSVDFEASGIGGVLPEDNFAIRVRRQQTHGQPSSVNRQKARKGRFYSKKIMDALHESPHEKDPVVTEQIISTTRKRLPNSTLPPPSFMPFDSTSSGDVDSDLDSDVSSTPSTSSSSVGLARVAATPQVNYISPVHAVNYSSQNDTTSLSGEVSEDEDNSGDYDEPSDSPPDFMGGSNSDSNMTGRFNDIPAGSSAATAGGGSGFNSPIDFGSGGIDLGPAHIQNQLRPSSSSSPPGLKRARTSDSINAALREPSKAQKLG